VVHPAERASDHRMVLRTFGLVAALRTQLVEFRCGDAVDLSRNRRNDPRAT
jgi:hypothetical protein